MTAAASSGSARVSGVARKAALIVVLAVLLLPFGIPRGLGRDGAPVIDLDARFAQLCRQHAGTPVGPRRCTVRYGKEVYLMDAITPTGFDADTARYQRLGCEEGERAQQAGTAAGEPPRSFVYHAVSGVCEVRAGHRQVGAKP